MATTIMRGIGWVAILAATAAAWDARRPTRDPLDGLAVIREATYREVDGRSLRLDLLLPESSDAPLPIVVAVHGGSWTGGSRREYAPQFAGLARGGVAVAVIDYRLARPGAPSWDGAVDDVRAAVGWLIDRADSFRLDPDRVAVLGTSAGGLLAARASQEDRRITAAVCLSTPTSLVDLAASRGLEHEPARLLLGVEPARDPGRASAASPIDHVTAASPPMLLIHGEDDGWVPLLQAREMHKKLDSAGVPGRIVVIPDARHGFELQLGPPDGRDLTPLVRDFLDAAWAGPRARATVSR